VDSANDADRIVEMSAQVDGILPCHSEVFDAATVARLDPRTKIIANHSVGVDHCDLDALKARHVINRESLALLPRGAILVNAARGAVVDEVALLEAIETGQLAAAGLDCFEHEPGGNPAFAAHENIFMLPHLGSATVQTRDAMGARALDNLDAYFAGREPLDRLV